MGLTLLHTIPLPLYPSMEQARESGHELQGPARFLGALWNACPLSNRPVHSIGGT